MSKKIIMLSLLIAGAGALIGYRIYQMVYYIDPFNGFFETKYNSSRIIFGVCVALFCAAVIIISRLDKQYPGRSISKSYALGSVTAAYAVAALFHAANLITPNIPSIQIPNIILGFLFCVYLIYYAACLFSRKKVSTAASIIPVVFFGFRLIVYFLDSLGLIKSSEVTLEIVALIACTLFWQMFGKYVSGVKFKSARKWMYAFGVIAIMLCLVCSVPSISVKYLADIPEKRLVPDDALFDMFTGIYIFVFIVISFSRKTCYRSYYLKQRAITEEEFDGID